MSSVDSFLEHTQDKFGLFEGSYVPLESPMIEGPELNSPKRNPDDGKKYVVYVKNPKTGNVKKITFGDKKGGLSSKILHLVIIAIVKRINYLQDTGRVDYPSMQRI